MSDLLAGYRKVKSFALRDGEHAVLRFVGGIDREFKWTDSNGIERTYVGVNVFLKKHSSEFYNGQCDTETVFRVGIGTTLDDWIVDGGIKEDQYNLIYKVDNSKTSGYGLRIEGREKK
ncbi:MAG: hypothetical protein [Circular genetic element sp.]|nr:MAG: hypothetical protein [Circular genetic element sp.]